MSTPVATAIHDIDSELAGQPSMSLRCMEWFAARKISRKTLLRNHIVEKEVCMSSKSSETETAIVFPSVYDGQVRGLKYRTLPRRWSQSTDFHTIWYGVDDIVGQDTVIIVEGTLSLDCCCAPVILVLPNQVSMSALHHKDAIRPIQTDVALPTHSPDPALLVLSASFNCLCTSRLWRAHTHMPCHAMPCQHHERLT